MKETSAPAGAEALARLAPHFLRVLVADPGLASSRLLSDLLRQLGARDVRTASTVERAVTLSAVMEPQVLVVEMSALGFDGVGFTRALRRSEQPCRKAPVIMIGGEVTAAHLRDARDAGVHEFLAKPYNTRDLALRLQAVVSKPRPWVEAIDYIGPDRRRFNSAEYAGRRRRRTEQVDGAAAMRLQALRILRTAFDAIDADPRQALRSMLAQAGELTRCGLAGKEMDLVAAAATLQRALGDAAQSGRLQKSALAQPVAVLLAFLPPDADEAPARAA